MALDPTLYPNVSSDADDLCGCGPKDVLVFTPALLIFTDLEVGQTSAPQQVTVKNTGTTAIGVGQLAVPAGFTLVGDTSFNLAPGAERAMAVAYTAISNDIRAGWMTLTAGVTGYDRSVMLVGSTGAKLIPVEGLPGDDGEDGDDGAPGKSAYELAQEQGFVGTLAEYLASLHGRDGDDGDPGTNGDDGEDGEDGRRGTMIWNESLFPDSGTAGAMLDIGDTRPYPAQPGYPGAPADWLDLDLIIDPHYDRLWRYHKGVNGAADYVEVLDNAFGARGLPGTPAPTTVKYRMSFFASKEVQAGELLFTHAIADGLTIAADISNWRATVHNRPTSECVLDVYGYGSGGLSALAAGAEITRPAEQHKLATITIPPTGAITFTKVNPGPAFYDANSGYRIAVFAPAVAPEGMAGLAVTMIGYIDLAAA